MNFQRKTLTTALVCALGVGGAGFLLATGAYAQSGEQKPAKIEKIEVTGSNIKRIEGETALPVTVITRQDIEKMGAVNTEDILRRISASTSMFSDTTQGAGYAQSNANLRGLGANSTLVLLNGRRVANHAFGNIGGAVAVDLNSIPFSAIERVEVLRDGASAVYGSDAIGGVINFITRSDFKGLEVSLRYGDTEAGIGGGERGATAAWGMGDLAKDNYNLLVTFGWQNNLRLKALEQRLYERGEREIDQPFPLTSYRGFPGRLMEFGLSPGAYTGDCNPVYTTIQVSGTTPSGDPRMRCRGRYAAYLDNLPDQRKWDLFGRFTRNLSNDHQLFAEVSIARAHNIGRIAPTPLSSDLTRIDPATGTRRAALYPTSGRHYPVDLLRSLGYDPFDTGVPGYADFAWRSEPGGNRITDVEAVQSRWVAGLKGVLAGWDYESALSYAQNEGTLHYTGFFHENRLLDAFQAGLINPFGPVDEAGLEALRAAEMRGEMRKSKGKTTQWDGKMSRELMPMGGGPLAVAVGANIRGEKVNDHPTNPDYSAGYHVGGEGTIPVVNASRTVTALYGELSIPFAKGWEAQVAARGDRYSDFGSKVSPRASVRWQPAKSMLFRASAGSGFRAPSLWDSKSPDSETNTADNVYDPGCPPGFEDDPRCFTQFTVRNMSSPSLKPEKSKQFTIGMVLEPTKDVSVSMDYWDIKKTDTIGSVNGQDILTDDTLFARYAPTRVFRDPAGFLLYIAQPLENLGGVKTSGLDLDLMSRFNVGPGKLTASLSGTLMTKFQAQQGKDTPYIDYLGQGGAGVFGGASYPRWQHTLTFDWEQGPYGVTLEQRFVRGWSEIAINNEPCAFEGDCSATHGVGDYSTFNLSARYTGFKNLKLTVGVRNILDREPPYVDSSSNGSHAAGYSNSVADPRGRFWWGSINYAFK